MGNVMLSELVARMRSTVATRVAGPMEGKVNVNWSIAVDRGPIAHANTLLRAG